MISSLQFQTAKCNYNCPVCRVSGRLPNIAGRFFIVSETKCQCNACNSIFDKDLFYAKPNDPSNLDGKWSIRRNAPTTAHTHTYARMESSIKDIRKDDVNSA